MPHEPQSAVSKPPDPRTLRSGDAEPVGERDVFLDNAKYLLIVLFAVAHSWEAVEWTRATTVMAVTVACVVTTHNLAIGVVLGCLVAMVIFAKRVAHLAEVSGVVDPDGNQAVYAVTGELFFASSNDLVYRFDYKGDPDDVVIDLTDAHIWDASSVAALDAIETKCAQRGKKVTIVGLIKPSAEMHDKPAGRLTAGH